MYMVKLWIAMIDLTENDNNGWPDDICLAPVFFLNQG